MDEDEVGQGQNEIVDNSADTGGTTETSQGNPAWDEALSAIPEEFHGHLKDHFGKWDKGVQTRLETVQQRYNPYKEFVDLNVPAQDISVALQLQHAINTQPESVFKYLQEQYKFGENQSQGQKAEEIENYDLDEESDPLKDPRLKAFAEKADRADQFMQQWQAKEAQKEIDAQVKTEVDAVTEKFPHLEMSDIASFAIGQANATKQLPNLMAAAEYLNSKFNPPARASDSAPPIVRSGNSRIPNPPAKRFGEMSSDERAAYVASRMEASSQV
jgi:hypothetical protein